MRVLEEPFLSRDAILSILRPGEIVTERPFRTLREHNAASAGLPVVLRTAGGQIVGRIRIYSALNADAARSYRLDERDAARALAERASSIERSPEAELVLEAVRERASSMPLDPLSHDGPPNLQRYLLLRRRSSWRALDPDGLTRDWLVQSSAWLRTNRDALVEAATALSRAADEARTDILGDAVTASSFFGVVQRMDPTAAEIESPDGEALLVPRGDLDRQGLAVLGQAVTLLREVLPGGGSYCLPMPAMLIDDQVPGSTVPVWETSYPDDGAIPAVFHARRDSEWMQRELAREPTAIPAAPLRVA